MVDVLFIEADSSRAAYQDLATDMSAIESPEKYRDSSSFLDINLFSM